MQKERNSQSGIYQEEIGKIDEERRDPMIIRVIL